MRVRLILWVVFLIPFGYEMMAPKIAECPERIPVLIEGVCIGMFVGLALAKWVK